MTKKISKKDKENFSNAQRCSCYHCLKHFFIQEVKKWSSDQPLCPYCKQDTIMLGKVDGKYLKQKHKRFFP